MSREIEVMFYQLLSGPRKPGGSGFADRARFYAKKIARHLRFA
jgi:hypothetical protein